MIFVHRERLDDNGNLIKPNARWFTNAKTVMAKVLERAGRLLDAEEPDDPPLAGLGFEPDRGIFAHDQVKMALKALFEGKCAYCESEVVAVTHLEVEHFRPKGRVAERDNHPGYYWLAYEWSNLYLACKLCNGKYRDQPTREDPTTGPAKGKYDQFPLIEEASRAMSHLDKVSRENRELLDPCRDRPEECLTFGLDGKALVIDGDPMATKSIEVFHLGRKGLKNKRCTRIEEVLTILKLMLDGGRRDLAKEAAAVYSKTSSHYSAACQAIWRFPKHFGLPADLDLLDA